MSDDTAAQRVEAFYNRPFQPKPPLSIDDRTVHAIEYAAAQLGIIARALVKIESHLNRAKGKTLEDLVTESYAPKTGEPQ